MENTSDSLMPRPLLLCLKSEKIVCYSVPDNTKERKLPLLEEVQSQLDEDEIVLAKDHQVEVGTSFDVKTDFTGLEIKDATKVKITFEEAKNEQGEDFITSHADTYKTVYHPQKRNQRKESQ